MNNKAPIKFLCARVQRNQADEAGEFLYRNGACLCLSLLGNYVKDVSASNILGFITQECTTLISVISTEQSHEILTQFYQQFSQKYAQCVAFTVPINAVSRNALMGCREIQKATKQFFAQEATQEQQKTKNQTPKEEN